MPAWTEAPESLLVHRRPAFYVHADTDRIYTRFPGAVFASGRVVPEFHGDVALTFYVTSDNQIVFLEPSTVGATWSNVVGRRSRRKALA